MFAVRQQEVEEGGLSVERVGQHQIERAWITLQHALQQTRGGGDFIFPGALHFMIQGHPQGLASGRRAGHQQQRHLPVVILNAVSGFEMDGPF